MERLARELNKRVKSYRSWDYSYDVVRERDQIEARQIVRALSTPRTETSEPVCAHPGCGLPEHLHGAPPGEPPNPTRSSHRFTPRTETSE